MSENVDKKESTWGIAFRVCVKHAPELLLHAAVQLVIRVPMYFLLIKLLIAYLKNTPFGAGMLWMLLGIIACFILLVMPARFIFGEVLRRWTDEYRYGSSAVPRRAGLLRRYPVYLMAGLKRLVKGIGAFPWAAVAIFVFHYYTVFAYYLEDYKASNAIIGGIPMMFLGSDLKAAEKMLYGALFMVIMVGISSLLAVLSWQRGHGNEYRLQPLEKIRSASGMGHIGLMLTNSLLSGASLVPAAWVLYDYARGHVEALFGAGNTLEKIDIAKKLLNEPPEDLGALLLKLILCAVLVYLPVRVYRRARGAAFITAKQVAEYEAEEAGE